MKDKKKVIEKDEMPSKGKVTAAWFMLIVLICCTGGLVYLKNFMSLETEPTEEKRPAISSGITTALTGIVEKFNESTLVSTYQTEGLTLIASVQDATIVVSYANTEANGSVIYTYIKNSENHNIVTSFQNSDKEINDKIFKVMVLACRERIGETEDVSSKIDEFLNGTTEAPGLTKESTEISSSYSINIVNPLKENQQNNLTSETTNNDTTTSATSDNTTSTTDNNTTQEEQTTSSENNTADNTSTIR